MPNGKLYGVKITILHAKMIIQCRNVLILTKDITDILKKEEEKGLSEIETEGNRELEGEKKK